MKRLFACTLLIFAAAPSLAADLNGYTAQYECRAGGPHCNVDVATLGNRACDQIVSTSMPWSSINWSNNTICLEAGDHTWKGALTIPPSASGSAGNYKVLRYTGINKDVPWKQVSGDQAKIKTMVVTGSNYWVFHRISFPPIDENLFQRIYAGSSTTNLIFDRILIEGMQSGYANAYAGIVIDCCGNNYITVQNSVIRNSWGKLGAEPHGINAADGSNIHIVNNEIYDWSAHPIQVGRNSMPIMPGFVVENNDLYADSSMYLSDGLGRHKSPMSTKAGATAGNIGRIIHNRVWGGRDQNAKTCCLVPSAGMGISFSGSDVYTTTGRTIDYILIQDNIIYDNQKGHGFYNNIYTHVSIIGNIYYKHAKYDSTTSSQAIEALHRLTESEIYLNAFIDNSDGGFTFSGDTKDVRCNVFIRGGSPSGTVSSSTVADYQAFYDTPSFSFNGTNTNIVKTVVARINSANYTAGTVMRWSDPKNCSLSTDAACYLYVATNTGTTFGSVPQPCTALGCIFNDGTIKWQAVRGPYTFYRKLRTSPQPYTIPYARAFTSSLEMGACPSNYATRGGIGINDVN